MKYKCLNCGQEHDEWPALAFSSPAQYNELTEEEKRAMGYLDSDFCIIKYNDQTDHFIRCTLTLKVMDHCQNLEYGVWASLSKDNYNDYAANFKNEEFAAQYFGWLCSFINEYDSTINIPTTVIIREGNKRPEVIPHQAFKHLFVEEYYKGITKAEADRRISEMLKMIGQIKTKAPGQKNHS